MRLTEILFDALELRDEARRRYLDRACGDDAAMRAEVEALLAADDAAGFSRFLSQPALDDIVEDGSTERADPRSLATRGETPEQIGPFRIVRELGFGGMGTVYLAEQTEPIERRVAVKVVHALHHERWRERFTAECQALARLNHPHIAALYEVGTTAVGGRALPYVAMEFVDGLPIDAWCDAEQATLERRLAVFVDVCSGVSHAHRHGILHCDLKPANVLIAEAEGLA
ncbi:MAG: protein kinase, partial [Acidobacteriota bacterium]